MIHFQFNENIVEDFRKGLCFLLSFYLHEKKGWVMKGVCEKRFILHAVSCPHSGGLVDIAGYFEHNKDLLKHLPYSNNVEIRDIKERDMKSYIESYDEEQKRYAKTISQRVLNWHRKKVKI